MIKMCQPACKFDLGKSERKSTQVNAIVLRPGQTKSQVGTSFQLASTCEAVALSGQRLASSFGFILCGRGIMRYLVHPSIHI